MESFFQRHKQIHEDHVAGIDSKRIPAYATERTTLGPALCRKEEEKKAYPGYQRSDELYVIQWIEIHKKNLLEHVIFNYINPKTDAHH